MLRHYRIAPNRSWCPDADVQHDLQMVPLCQAFNNSLERTSSETFCSCWQSDHASVVHALSCGKSFVANDELLEQDCLFMLQHASRSIAH